MSLDKFKKPYDPTSVESDIYSEWEKSGYFNPDVCVSKGVTLPDAETFSIVLPPPNETGILHVGHASMAAIEDAFVRFNRMRGKKTLWVPGTDHAAIATNAVVEKNLGKKNIKRHDIGREAFLKEVEAHTQSSRGTILSQIRTLGASLDWSRLAYTLDEKRNTAVTTAFKTLYELGLIYRGDRIVNWDTKAQTVISDDEIVWKEETVPFYYLQYGPFQIGTARPETKFGDKYVVMHPDDARYKEYTHGQTIELEWINGPVTATVIKDPVIDMEFGTGVMTITPWHDKTDFELAQRYQLEKQQIIDTFGKLLPVAGEFAGLKITDARTKVIEKLKEKGLLVKVDEKYTHQVATSERTEAVIEPQIMRQWFIAVDKTFTLPHSELSGFKAGDSVTLKELMLSVVKNGDIKILPDRFEKVYYHWVENLYDWCISRQIWFGHRIPAWYRSAELTTGKGEEVFVGDAAPGAEWTQDEDTLDTWFSSGLWTFSTLGWPEETSDLKAYHPTSILETGYDILFFWIARMILMSTSLLGQIPFKTVYLHGLVRDGQGRKISKSLGNNIDPVDMSTKYGTDALRMSLVVGVGPGNDNNLSEDKIRAHKKFANKLWNIARFVLEAAQDTPDEQPQLRPEDTTRVEELSALAKEITQDYEQYRLYLAGEKLYHYIWHTLADVILEERKAVLSGDDAAARHSAQWTLLYILSVSLKLLHPLMPFITEEIWKSLPNRDRDMLMVASWPTS